MIRCSGKPGGGQLCKNVDKSWSTCSKTIVNTKSVGESVGVVENDWNASNILKQEVINF